MTDPSQPAPTPEATEPLPTLPPAPFDREDLRRAVRAPGQTIEIVLTQRSRLAASIAGGEAPWLLVVLLVACTVVASLPYGLVSGPASFWRIAALFGGSVLVCAPSLQVFSAYLGAELRPAQTLALALLVAAVASLFTLGFAPIAWFLRATMEHGDLVDAEVASLVLLATSLLAGVLHFCRCVGDDARLRPQASLPLFLGWLCLLLFVSLRMARALDLVV